jgi:hypothetical protein
MLLQADKPRSQKKGGWLEEGGGEGVNQSPFPFCFVPAIHITGFIWTPFPLAL